MPERVVPLEGTYGLPEAQLDRFLLRLSFGYPSADEEWQVLARYTAADVAPLDAVINAEELLGLQALAGSVHVSEAVGRYLVSLVQATRTHRQVTLGASPRGAIALKVCGQALALMGGRTFVAPEDVQELAVSSAQGNVHAQRGRPGPLLSWADDPPREPAPPPPVEPRRRRARLRGGLRGGGRRGGGRRRGGVRWSTAR